MSGCGTWEPGGEPGWGGVEDGEVLGDSRQETGVAGQMQAAPGAGDRTRGTRVSAQLAVGTKCCNPDSLPRSAAFISGSVFSNLGALPAHSCRQWVGFVLGSKIERPCPSRVFSSRTRGSMPCPFRPGLWNGPPALLPKPAGQSKPRGQAGHERGRKEHMSCGDGGGERVVTEQRPILAPCSSPGQSRQALDESPGLLESFSAKAGDPCAPRLHRLLCGPDSFSVIKSRSDCVSTAGHIRPPISPAG